jgi:hypothetical protein
MHRSHTLTRTLVAALAIVALAAPPALAHPGGPASPAAREAIARAEHARDLRTTPPYWSYEYQAPAPQAAPSVESDDGTSWTAIAGGLAGACLLVGGLAATAVRSRVRARVPA